MSAKCPVTVLIVVVEGGVLVPEGDRVNLQCPDASSSSDVDWAMQAFSPNSSVPHYERIATDCTVLENYTSLFDVSDQCDLVIVNASRHHGGIYVCYYVNGTMSDKIYLSVIGKSDI